MLKWSKITSSRVNIDSLSDLLSDFVTLYTFKMSRKVPDPIYPYGYGKIWTRFFRVLAVDPRFFFYIIIIIGKYETMGSLSVSALLIAGGLGIGIHSLELLLATLNQIPLTSATDAIAAVKRSNDTLLDPNAAWFALSSVLVKEWLYRISKSIWFIITKNMRIYATK